MKKVFKGFVCLIVIITIVCGVITVSADGSTYGVKKFQIGEWVYDSTFSGITSANNIYWYKSGVSSPQQEVHFSTPSNFVVGDRVTCSFTVYSHYQTYGAIVYLDSYCDPYLIENNSEVVGLEGEPFTKIQYSFSYTFSSAVTTDLFLIIRSNSDWNMFGIGDITWSTSTDSSVITNQITQNNNANTDREIANDNANTDKITNGYQTDSNLDSEVDGNTSELENSTDEALGGKSDEEINQEIGNIFEFDDSRIDWTATFKVQTFWDNLLAAFGGKYTALLMLSLTLGLGAFLIGKRYG